MKKRLTGYTFDASAKTVTHADFSDIGLGGIQMIINVTDNVIIYNFSDPAKGGSLSTDTLTLTFDTTSMSDTDDLMVLAEDGVATQAITASSLPLPTGAATAANQQTDALTDTELRATPVPVDLGANNDVTVTGTVDLGATDNAVLDSIAAKDFATQTTLALIKAKTDNLDTALSGIKTGTDKIVTGALTESDFDTKTGSLTETAPGTDTDSSGLNGRLQRIAQRLTSLIALIPASLGQKTKANSMSVTLASDQDTVPVSGTFYQATQPVSAASLPLPSGASTSAKQPALGTAGTASTDVITVQGIASMTAVKVDGSAVTQPVSGTVSANATLSAETTKVIGTVNVSAGQTIGITANSSVNVAQINGVATTMGNGVSGTGVQRVTIASDSTGQVALATGSNAIGKLAANSGVDIGDVDVTSAVITGSSTAHDAADANNPIKIGGKVTLTEQTAVSAANDRVDAAFTSTGKLITSPFTAPEYLVDGTPLTLTDTTSTSCMAAPAAGLRNYITQILVTNSHATVGTLVKIQDGSGGTTIYQGYAASVGGGFSISFPVPLRQPTTATAIYVACGTTGSNTYVSMCGYKGI